MNSERQNMLGTIILAEICHTRSRTKRIPVDVAGGATVVPGGKSVPVGDGMSPFVNCGPSI
jgi:hypothetical protein